MLKKFKGEFWRRTEIEKTIDDYLCLPLTLPITDEPMRRVCQALTNCGYTTYASCDGHGKDIPMIWLYCLKDQRRSISKLERIIAHQREGLIADKTNYAWHLLVEWHELKIPRIPFVLKPVAFWEEVTTIDYKKVIQDLDIIGIGVLHYLEHKQNILL